MRSIDWATLKDMLGSVSAIFVAAVAFMGFNRWRDELMGKSRYATAHKIFSLAFQFRNDYLRAVLGIPLPDEWKDRQPDQNESPERTKLLNEWYARSRRAAKLRRTCDELERACQDAEILMNVNSYELVQPFEKIWGELYGAIGVYFSDELNDRIEPVLHRQNRETVWGTGQSSRSNKVDAAIDHLKQRLLKHVTPEPFYVGLWSRMRKTRTGTVSDSRARSATSKTG